MTDARVTQTGIEQWGQGTPAARVTQTAAEVWAGVTPGLSSAVVSQVAVEQWAVSPVVVPPSSGGQTAVTINTG